MQVVEIFARSCGKGRQNKACLCRLRCFLSFATTCFIIIAANHDRGVRERAPHDICHDRQIVGRECHIHGTVAGKMDTGSSGVSFTKGKGFFRLAGNNEMSSLNFSAHEKALRSVRSDVLQALYLA